MDWKFWKKRQVELQLYESFPKPTKIRVNRQPLSGKMGAELAEEVKAAFLRMDQAYDNLFEKAFKDSGGIDEIDGHVSDLVPNGVTFSVTLENKLEISAAHNLWGTEIIGFSVADSKYQLIKVDKGWYNRAELPESDKGYWWFLGKVGKSDYERLIEPNCPVGLDTKTKESKKDCSQNENGYCSATMKAEAVPELMKRIISYAGESRGV